MRRAIIIVGGIIGGLIVLSAVAALASNGRDNSGKTVRASGWADDVCGTVGAWQGQLKDIREELRHNNWAARRSDGSTGDSDEQVVTVHDAVDRAILATEQTLQEGLKRAGTPEANQGAQASQILRQWADQTEQNLRVAKAEIKQKPTSVSEAFASLGPPIEALARSAVDGRAAFKKVAALDPALGDALNGSGNCRRLTEKKP
ncbi:MAG: hypothetical protein ACXVRE_01815 [Gaiellaceae bacterium]